MHIDIKFVKDNYKKFFGEEIQVRGWIKSIRSMKNLDFISINDGSTCYNIQCIATENQPRKNLKEINAGTGSGISVIGILNPSKGKQDFELKITKIDFLSEIDLEAYPLQKKEHTLDFIRSLPHLRSQTYKFAAIMRIRSALSFSTHEFFKKERFIYSAFPILTTSDCEGAGETLSIDKNNGIFEKKMHLTVSAQMHAETLAIGMGRVYSFGPTFRAENSNTSRHLSEFWMIEPEISFMKRDQLMEFSEIYIKYIIDYTLKNNLDDILYVSGGNEKHLAKLNAIVTSSFVKLSYTEAVKILQKKEFDGAKIRWGDDLHSNAEKYILETFNNVPVIVYDYPKTLKPFYMKQNEDEKTVGAIDVLMPGIGEVLGGSEREYDLDKLLRAVKEKEIDSKEYEWYIDTRRFGSVPHSGFGLGLERIVRFVSNSSNIRDTIPFPRHPGTCLY